ncbi:MAG TPA: GAF domain-containing protein [Vicinamibacterales bacterium]|nr:GAF domain-containing protein [Vicinamibacterales bacterium]
MRSRAARSIIVALAVVAIAAAAAFLYRTEKEIAESTVALRAFDLHAREATDALADLRAGQQAYVAAGQGVTFWMPKVAATTDNVTGAIRALRQSAASADGRAALDRAASTVNDFAEVDKRARDYLKSGQQLMAGDVIFTEGTESAANAARQVEAARLAEHQAFDQTSSQTRKQEAIALAASGGIVLLGLLLLAPTPSTAHADATLAPAEGLAEEESTARLVPNAGRPAAAKASDASDAAAPLEAPRSHAKSSSVGPIMKSAAEVATDVGRVRDLSDLERLIGRVADLMDASGVVVWVGNTTGADLRAALAHGYSPQVVARMPAVPRSADNAAAAAYRTGTLQIVLSRPGGAGGAIVAPILTADGCIGALSAEIRHGGEASETVQALATIFAAQLANVISAPVETAASGTKTASA